MAAYISSSDVKHSFFSMPGRFSSLVSSFSVTPVRFSSDSKLCRPLTMFSSRFSFLNHCLIFVRAPLLLQIFSQSRLGPGAFFDVRMSTMSPFCST